MTELKNDEDKVHTIEIFENIPSPCKYIWTPVTDKARDQEYISVLTGKKVTYLPWEFSEPNGFTDESLVLLNLETKGYFDNVNTKKPTCTACDIHKSTIFSLIGVCKETYFGNMY